MFYAVLVMVFFVYVGHLTYICFNYITISITIYVMGCYYNRGQSFICDPGVIFC